MHIQFFKGQPKSDNRSRYFESSGMILRKQNKAVTRFMYCNRQEIILFVYSPVHYNVCFSKELQKIYFQFIAAMTEIFKKK